jgi:hypothetical protein
LHNSLLSCKDWQDTEFKTLLEEALSDHFVCGLASKAIQNLSAVKAWVR